LAPIGILFERHFSMTRTRVASAAALIGAATWLLLAHGIPLVRELASGPEDRADDGPGEARMAAIPAPTTPPPWSGSVLATVLGQGSTKAVALVGIDGIDGIDGGAPARQLATGFDEIGRLAWSPDGRSLAFAGRRGGNWDLYRVDRDGAGLARLTDHPAFDGWPAWSPDGREIAFVSYRDGNLDVYRLPVSGGAAGDPPVEGGGAVPADGAASRLDAGAVRVTAGEGPAIEPAWSPDGRWIAVAAWHEGAYRLEAVAPSGGTPTVIAEPTEGMDLRSPAWAPDGRQLAYLEQRHGAKQLVVRSWEPGDATPDRTTATLAARVTAFDWFPGGGALVFATADRGGGEVRIRGHLAGGGWQTVAMPARAEGLSWARGPLPEGLPELEPVRVEAPSAAPPLPGMGGAGVAQAAQAAQAAAAPDAGGSDARPGLASLDDVRVSGARIHAGLAGDFAAMRAEVRAAVGADFLGTLSDLWRPVGFASRGSAFFSWHKLGRAFDTQMEFRGPGGRRDMVLVREETDGRTQWRMLLRAAAQDGSAGRPITEAGWTFAAGSGDPELTREGGRRSGSVPAGYWVDFTAIAERYGWRRIPSLSRPGLDWRRDWEAIEYWHYERRDGLRWFEAARQVYPEEHLATQLHPERLNDLDISLQRLVRLGFPPGWPNEG